MNNGQLQYERMTTDGEVRCAVSTAFFISFMPHIFQKLMCARCRRQQRYQCVSAGVPLRIDAVSQNEHSAEIDKSEMAISNQAAIINSLIILLDCNNAIDLPTR